ncbi:Fatty acid synthase [Camponotus floridanus]|uniref:Fatty acid synthase n=1 Tax=Camponotus floridanus TaxID=104421 RepID=E2B290_CAMFO|nr:Fatty acid synthase [Camponotus floridanus]
MPTYFEGDIVIAGISGRLPESSNIEEFKENLMNGTDMVTEDDRRWKPGLYGLPSRFGKLKDLHSFDASFFKISPKQAHIMDPQMRIMLEVTFEALIDAGINPSTLKKSHTGVFIGVYTSDANDFWKRKPESHEWFRSSKGMIANRISYTFDLIGPSFLVDTLCSSSLTAMHQAILAIRSGECDAAIVGGLNLVLDPVNSLHYHHMNILSTDGKCKSFDISADGYVRSEAVVAIYLQKMTDARRVYATVMNTAINMDGYKPEGIMHPSGDMQYMMLQKMYNEVNIDPKNVVYVEAHGTGTKAGDLGELDAIDKLFCKDRKTPLLIGSVKSNMGHAEAASGLSGIAKVLIAMETGVIPANLHFAVPNPNICALTEGRIRVIDKATPWNGGLVGISSFGIGGTNSHVILRSNSKVKVSLDHAVETRLPKLVAVSGRTKEAVQIILNKANEHQQNNEFLSLLYSLHSDNISEHNIRGYEILAYDSTREIVEANYDEKRPVWFIFSGINSQWPGMGRELLHIETCQRSLQRCADVLKEHDVDLMNIIINGTDETYENVLVATVSINMHLIIAAEVLSGRSCFVLKNLAATLSSNCFILLEETGIFDLKIALKEAHLMLIGKQIDSSGKSYFLLRKRKVRKEPILIEITENDFSWLANAKAALSKFDSENQDVLFVSQSEELLGLIGFVHCIRREVANVRYIYIEDSNAPKFDLLSQFYVEQLEKGLKANVLKGGQWGSYRHLQLDQHIYVELEHAYVDTLTTGNLNSLEWIQSPLTDILLATGKLSADALSSLGLTTEDYVLGLEFSGRDANGCRVMGLTKSRGLATTVLPDSDFLWKVPEEWTLEQAATIPFAYVISYYALFVRGRLKAGKNVLIHSGAGAVGLAAINIALHAGCTVFATVGTEEKRLYLKKTFSQLTDKHIGNSRDTSFEQLILDETQGCGVDVVLNSLSEKKLHASVRCLAKNGRFLDIGKYDMLNGNRIDMSIFLKNISYHGILLEMLFEDSEDKLETVRLISEGIENGVVRPLPTTVFSKQSLEEGFRFMMAGKHIGKVLLKIRDEEPQKHMLSMQTTVAAIPRTYMYPDKSYVLIGGLGGFGLELANWMITRGARFIVLVSRTGIRTGYQMSRVQHWRNNGIKVIISTADITTFSGAECLIDESNRLAPVGGIFNLAVVLRDALFENLQVVDFETVILPKVNGTRNLDVVSRKSCPSLDLFVVFSTIASSRGNASQSNYGLANSAIEKIIEQRHTAGLPGLAIQWGVIGDVGLYIDSMKDKNIGITRIGVLPQRVSSCLETIDVFLQQPYPIVSSTVIAEKRKSVNNDDSIDHVVHVIANILGIENISVNINDSFDKFGIDSLSYMEIKQILEREYGILLSLREMYVLTLSKLLDLLAKNDVSHNPSTS